MTVNLTERAPAGVSAEAARELAEVFGVMSDPTRLAIMLMLLVSRGECSAGSIAAALGQPQPTVSHHLARLRGTSLLTARRQGKNVYYSLGPRASIVGGWVAGAAPAMAIEASGYHLRLERA
jgi:DNA-binding transcriptional ArsR family regulator